MESHTMISGAAVEAIIFQGLHALNDELNDASKITVDIHTALFGVNAEIDSLSLVSLIVDIETALNSEYNLEVSLTDDRAMTRAESPFTDVLALKGYIMELIGEL